MQVAGNIFRKYLSRYRAAVAHVLIRSSLKLSKRSEYETAFLRLVSIPKLSSCAVWTGSARSCSMKPAVLATRASHQDSRAHAVLSTCSLETITLYDQISSLNHIVILVSSRKPTIHALPYKFQTRHPSDSIPRDGTPSPEHRRQNHKPLC